MCWQSAKTISASVAFPAYIHSLDPTIEIISVSYAQSLATKLHNDNRSTVSTKWYKNVFPKTRVDSKKATEQKVRLTKRGNRFANSVGGVLTGRGGDIIIIDDPLKPDEAMSEARRNAVVDWYSNTLLSKLNQKKGAIVIVMQRIHVHNLVRHFTQCEGHGWTALKFLGIAEEYQIIDVGNGLTHYRRKGDLLHPELEDHAVLDELRFNIGSEEIEAQNQQKPVPPGGNIFKWGWPFCYDRLPEITGGDTVV